jgi:hypothetical protein
MRLSFFTIDVREPVQIAWWAQELRVSQSALLAAIAAVGERADAVSNYLKSMDTTSTRAAHRRNSR